MGLKANAWYSTWSRNGNATRRPCVSNAYIPPELLPLDAPSVERAMSAMQEIQSHSVQALAPGTVPVAAPTSPLLPPPVAEPSTPSRPPSWDNLERSYSAKIGKAHVERVLQQNPDWGFQIFNGKILPSLEAVQRDYADPKTRAGVLKLLFLHPELGFEEADGTITEVEF